MNEPRRARTSATADWDRARRAYLALVAGADPVAEVITRLDPLDLRPGGPAPPDRDPARAVVVSGPGDMIELRQVVERAVGVGTWPEPSPAEGASHTKCLVLERPALAIALLLAMEGLIIDRSPWRKWRTAVDTMAPAIADIDELTLVAVVLDSSGRPIHAGPSQRV